MSGVGGVFLPILTGQLMTLYGANMLIAILGLSFFIISAYGVYRSTKRAIPDIDLSTSHVAIMPQATNVAVEISQEIAIEDTMNSGIEQKG